MLVKTLYDYDIYHLLSRSVYSKQFSSVLAQDVFFLSVRD